MLKLKRILMLLVPDEPFVPYYHDFPVIPEAMPVSIRAWCIALVAVNVVAAAIGSLLMHSLVPAMLFLIATLLGPIQAVVWWRYTARKLNGFLDGSDTAPVIFRPTIPGPIVSIQWCLITVLLLSSALPIALLVRVSAGLHG
jgi:hypothetical protein